MELIGKGSFTKAYKKDNKTALIVSTDKIKECMSLDWFPNSNLFPKVKRVAYNDDGTQSYEMNLYNKVTKPTELKESHYALYKQLRELQGNGDYSELVRRFSESTLPRHVKRVLIEAVEAITNYDTFIGFEISPRNIAITKNKCLVLLDCFFLPNDLKRGIK